MTLSDKLIQIKVFGDFTISNDSKNRYIAKVKGKIVSLQGHPQSSIELAIDSLYKRIKENLIILIELHK